MLCVKRGEMMTIKVIQRFSYGLVIREVGDVLEVSEKRARELIDKGFAETAPKPKKTKGSDN